jgi:hypothetical protein
MSIGLSDLKTRESFSGGPNSNPNFYAAPGTKEPPMSIGEKIVMNHTPVGIAVKQAVSYAKSPEFREAVESGKEKLAAGVDRARAMIDDIRGAIPQGVKDAAASASDRVAPALAPLRRGISEAFSAEPSRVHPRKDGSEHSR